MFTKAQVSATKSATTAAGSRGVVTAQTANGTASLMPHRALRVKRGQRFLTNAGLGHMGSGLPLAVGCADPKDKVRDLIQWCVSDEYFALRAHLGLAIA